MHANNGQESSLTAAGRHAGVDAGGQDARARPDVAVGTGQDAGRVLSLVVKVPRSRAFRHPGYCG